MSEAAGLDPAPWCLQEREEREERKPKKKKTAPPPPPAPTTIDKEPEIMEVNL